MSILQIGDRQYRIFVHLGYDGSIRKVKTKTVDLSHLSQKKADKQIVIIEEEFREQVKGNPSGDASMTLRRFVEDVWRENYAEENLRPKTLLSYNAELDKRILPELGYLKLPDVTPVRLMTFYKKISKQTYVRGGKTILLSGRTVKYQHQILSSILSQAVQWKIIKENPCKLVTPPKQNTGTKKIKYWEKQEAIAFMLSIQEQPLKYLCASELGLIGGLRTEEILGLDVNDFTDDGVFVKRTSKLVGKQGMVIENMAKNKTSERFVTLPDNVLRNLRKLALEQKLAHFKLQNMWNTERYDGILLFTQADGAPMCGTTLNNWFKRYIATYTESHEDQLSPITFHGLRHTNAALMVCLGADVKVGAGRMGHAKTSTFLDMYGGMMATADKEISEKLGCLLPLQK